MGHICKKEPVDVLCKTVRGIQEAQVKGNAAGWPSWNSVSNPDVSAKFQTMLTINQINLLKNLKMCKIRVNTHSDRWMMYEYKNNPYPNSRLYADCCGHRILSVQTELRQHFMAALVDAAWLQIPWAPLWVRLFGMEYQSAFSASIVIIGILTEGLWWAERLSWWAEPNHLSFDPADPSTRFARSGWQQSLY